MRSVLSIIALASLLAVGCSEGQETTTANQPLPLRSEQSSPSQQPNVAATPDPAPSNRDVIGRWSDDRPFVAGRITIFGESGKLFVEHAFSDGSDLKYEVVERNSPLGRRFDTPDNSSNGDYWVIGLDGALQIRDADGLIATANPI